MPNLIGLNLFENVEFAVIWYAVPSPHDASYMNCHPVSPMTTTLPPNFTCFLELVYGYKPPVVKLTFIGDVVSEESRNCVIIEQSPDGGTLVAEDSEVVIRFKKQ
ncbi:hypothetical protein P9597_29590 [Aneurinibacillus migulanus]|uniref:hypothetical protein n=1 Tax=Aneurinibacillus migulanus TaxID=47500 RepID=UPI002E1F3A0D|nr:hypothetical protein [Aneurinibacillus migulanus]